MHVVVAAAAAPLGLRTLLRSRRRLLMLMGLRGPLRLLLLLLLLRPLRLRPFVERDRVPRGLPVDREDARPLLEEAEQLQAKRGKQPLHARVVGAEVRGERHAAIESDEVGEEMGEGCGRGVEVVSVCALARAAGGAASVRWSALVHRAKTHYRSVELNPE